MEITDTGKIKVVAMDLDGTLTQHKTGLCDRNRETLVRLSERYKLLMVGAGQVMRIFRQMGEFPLDIIGNYGMQYGVYDSVTGEMNLQKDLVLPCDRKSVEERVTYCRNRFGYTEYTGENVEFHPSGCVTFPILGTKAVPEEKLAFDPDRKKRRAIYNEVKEIFSDYEVFVGGSSSFDMAPKPWNKAYALSEYCARHGIAHDEAVYIGDDYGPGGNDESVYLSDFPYLTIDNYLEFPETVECLLK